MVSRRFVSRIAQSMLLVLLGLWVHTAQARPCRDCDECPGSSCISDQRVCESCPVPWWGSCYAGTEGCGHYECNKTEDKCCLLGSTCADVCDCPPCIDK